MSNRVDAPRRVALDVLVAVRERRAYANLALPALLRERGITGRDAAFATELAYGTLRWRGRLDAVLQCCVDRPLARLDPGLLDVLRLGAHQLLDMRVPSHAAVSSSVELARAVSGHGPAKLANAVLRKVGSRPLDAWVVDAAPPYEADPVGHLAVTTSHPEWIVEALRDALRGDLDQTRMALDADNLAPLVHLAARPGLVDRAELAAHGEPGPWSPYAVRLTAGHPGDIAAVRDGRAGVQDEGSQLVALALAAAPVEGRDGRWLDLCAGPGGKAALLAGLAGERDARLLAVEIAAHRARLVDRALHRLGAGVVVQADGRRPPVAAASCDRVLVDAPCSGLGALRRRPDARWQHTPDDLAGLGELQRDLLRAAVDATRPGGVVAYVTCSPHPAETAAVVDDVLAAMPQLRVLDAPAVLNEFAVTGAASETLAGAAQLWPHRHGTDAMFIALLQVG